MIANSPRQIYALSIYAWYSRNQLNGVKPRPTFVEFIYFVDNRIKYPDITATLTRDSPPLTQLDGISMMELEEQPRRAMLERQQEDVIRQIASDTGTSSH